ENYDSYDCRGQNRVKGAKLSEHGKANALDIRSVKLANGKVVRLTDISVARTFRERIRASACTRFMTVLGPGSDGYHEEHVHVDLAERHGDYRICQWEIRDPSETAGIPLPRPRPFPLSAGPRLRRASTGPATIAGRFLQDPTPCRSATSRSATSRRSRIPTPTWRSCARPARW